MVPGVAVAPWAMEPGETYMSREPRGEDVAVVGAGAASQSGVIPRAHEHDAERIVDVELSRGARPGWGARSLGWGARPG